MDPSERPSQARFATTHWSLIVTARAEGAPESREALSQLCETYWYPLYAYLRHRGHAAHEAEDLVQGFFARFLEKNYLQNVKPEKGKFRSYLLGALRHHVANERDRAQAKKRGGGRKVLSLEMDTAEHRYSLEPGHDQTAARIFERSWAVTLLGQVLGHLRDENIAASKAEVFDHLKVYLTGRGAVDSYKKAAEALHMSEGAVKVAVHRLRLRYRDLLKEEIARTVSGRKDVDVSKSPSVVSTFFPESRVVDSAPVEFWPTAGTRIPGASESWSTRAAGKTLSTKRISRRGWSSTNRSRDRRRRRNRCRRGFRGPTWPAHEPRHNVRCPELLRKHGSE